MANGNEPLPEERAGSRSAGRPPSSRGRSYFDLTGESIEQTLDLSSWAPADRLAEQFDRIQREIESALIRETESRSAIRERIFPLLRSRAEAPPNAGVHRVSLDALRSVQQSLL